MDYSFINVHTKSKVVLETDNYLIRRRIKSKLSFSDNYLEIKNVPTTEEEMDNYISVCRNYFRDNGVDFIHIALPENQDINKKINKYLKKEDFNRMEFALYVLDSRKYECLFNNNYTVEQLTKVDYDRYSNFMYNVDLELANEEWADHNRDSVYENIRSEDMMQIVAKDNDKIIGTVNIIIDDDFIEIDNLYVLEKYRRKGVASYLINYAIKELGKDYVILVADEADTPKYMYENMKFKKVSSKIYYLKSNLF